jgi:hypothetical protein
MAFIGNGAQLTSLEAGDIASGTVATARLASGTANSSTYLRGDQTWATISGGVTSLNGQTGAITNTDYGAIGSYVIAANNDFSASLVKDPNVTVSGSSLIRANPSDVNATGINGTTSPSVQSSAQASLGLSGTWRSMTRAKNNSAGTLSGINLYVRIS